MSKPDLRGARVAITGERRAEEQAALVRTLNGYPVASFADAQYALHRAPASLLHWRHTRPNYNQAR